MRSDGRRNRAALLAAAGRCLARGAPFTLADVAALAGVSTATAYRHFGSADDVADAYVAGFLEEVAQAAAADAAITTGAPADRLRAFDRLWVEQVLAWGPALVRLRSSEGFLARRQRVEAQVVGSLAQVEPILAANLPGEPAAERVAYAVAVWNALADPREVLDLRATLGWDAGRIAARLDATVLAVLATA